ncbi:hypothetical protein [Fictibacillus phosphorivorans]|uniref:hypothetical protein n=1 Tax=Fictibacillus phosphorivorans TaxID=1221500 RepID=UPI002040E2F9|nr:hypothetical protein [Fictibacillus phosphorivorans]MCM3718372.1 hypothetical protein [Fictibacillus phosphorivorans]MCM3775996.1 hypothetical protein [Fictibacillus phosphorivorans]
MLKKHTKNLFSPYRRFPEPFGDEVTETVVKQEALTVSKENGCDSYFKLIDDLPTVFGRS